MKITYVVARSFFNLIMTIVGLMGGVFGALCYYRVIQVADVVSYITMSLGATTILIALYQQSCLVYDARVTESAN